MHVVVLNEKSLFKIFFPNDLEYVDPIALQNINNHVTIPATHYNFPIAKTQPHYLECIDDTNTEPSAPMYRQDQVEKNGKFLTNKNIIVIHVIEKSLVRNR